MLELIEPAGKNPARAKWPGKVAREGGQARWPSKMAKSRKERQELVEPKKPG
jgi:hypothetical protein